MPLTIYRRHLTTCRHAGKRRRDAWSQKCDCPIWVQGSLGGEYLRRSRAVSTDIVNSPVRVVVAVTNTRILRQGVERRQRMAHDHSHDDVSPAATL
jgi:hypothetical protein